MRMTMRMMGWMAALGCVVALNAPIANATATATTHAKLGTWFEANHGQAPADVAFVGKSRGRALGLGADGVRLDVGGAPVRMVFTGAAAAPRLEGRELLPGRSNYLRGDRAQWQTGVPHFARVRYLDAWRGIDVEFREGGSDLDRQLEYDFLLAPGADPARIGLRFEGADAVAIDASGDLLIRARGAELRQRAPLVFQQRDGERHVVASRYVQRDGGTIGVDVDDYDATQPLVVDPVLVYATALGGADFEKGYDVALDASGAAYIAGEVKSTTGFPLLNPLQPALAGGKDAFVVKLTPSGALLYATYYGGSGDDEAWSIGVDETNAVYLSGRTSSTDLPTQNPIQAANAGGFDAFVAKLAPGGASLVYATYLGGTADDNAEALAVGASHQVALKGVTESDDFPLESAVVPEYRGDRDAFLTQIAPDGASLEWSTYFGGTGAEDPDQTGVGIAIDADGNVVACGTTESEDFPTAAPMQAEHGGGTRDAYLAKFTPAGAVVFSTYLGRAGGDTLRAVTVDAKGFIYATGASRSFNFPLVNPLQKRKSIHYDVIVIKVDPAGQSLLFSTYLGGNFADAGRSIAVDDKGNVYIHGQTASTDFPQLQPLKNQFPALSSEFVAKLAPSGSALIYSTYLGGAADEAAFSENVGIAVDANRNVTVAGSTASPNALFVNAIDSTVGTFDAYVARFGATVELELSMGGTQAAPTFSVRLKNPTPTAADTQLKVFRRTSPGSAPMAVDIGVPPLATLPSGANALQIDARALGSAFTPGEVVTARLLDRLTGQLLSESLCTEVPCQ